MSSHIFSVFSSSSSETHPKLNTPTTSVVCCEFDSMNMNEEQQRIRDVGVCTTLSTLLAAGQLERKP